MTMRLRTFLSGAAVGAAAAYLLDPVSGRGRRTRGRDRLLAALRRNRERAERRGRYLGHLAQGKLAELRSPGPDRADADDVTIAQRVHSEVLGRADVPNDRVSVEVVDGVATLRGELDSSSEAAALASRVARVPGVRDVRTLIHLPGEPAPNKAAALRASEDAAVDQPARGRSAG